ncbi:polysaccharide biosynthesis C-terminal domain-containing protein, partial [Streptomyces scabiei]
PILFQIYKVRTQVDLKKVFLNVPKYLIAGLVMFLIVIKVNTSTHFNVISLIGQIALGIVTYTGGLLILRPTILNKVQKIVANYKSRK